MKSALREWVTAFQQLIFPEPPCCIICGTPFQRDHFRQHSVESTGYVLELEAAIANDLCSGCLTGITWINRPYCQICGRIVTDGMGEIDGLGRCRDCRSQKRRSFQYSRSAAAYDGTVQEMIYQFKYRGQRQMGSVLAKVMLGAFDHYYGDVAIDILVPVPLHGERLEERGFNQSLYLCREIERLRRIPVADILLRSCPTGKQSKKGRWQRMHSLTNVFSWEQADEISGKQVLLIDDIYTTGATVDACAAALLSAQAAAVYVLTMAR